MRIAHLSDTHLGYRALGRVDPASGRNQREVDFERAFEDAVRRIVSWEPDVVVHSGDVFHQVRPGWRAVAEFIAEWRRIEEAGIPAFVIGGNHDTPRLRTTGSVFTALEQALDRTTFVYGYDYVPYQVRGRWFHLVPWGALPWRWEDVEEGGVVVGHGDPNQFPKGLVRGAEYVALGHLHERQKACDRGWYAGSTERCGWSDAPALPGWLKVDLSTTRPPQVVRTPARDMIRLEPVGFDGHRETCDRVLEQLVDPEAMFRVQVTGADRTQMRELRRELEKGARDLAFALHVDGDVIPTGSVEGPIIAGAMKPLLEMFQDFLDEREEAGLLNRKARKLMQEQGLAALERAIERQKEEE